MDDLHIICKNIFENTMLEILEKQSIYNVVVIVTRYFGGILLGTGGLVRAYSDSLKEAIKKSTLVEQEPGYEAEIKLPYTDFEKFKYYCNKNNINLHYYYIIFI